MRYKQRAEFVCLLTICSPHHPIHGYRPAPVPVQTYAGIRLQRDNKTIGVRCPAAARIAFKLNLHDLHGLSVLHCVKLATGDVLKEDSKREGWRRSGSEREHRRWRPPEEDLVTCSMQQLILREYTTVRCNKVFDLSSESGAKNKRRGLVGRTRKEQGRQVLQEKIFARAKKKTTLAGAVGKSSLPSIPVPRHSTISILYKTLYTLKSTCGGPGFGTFSKSFPNSGQKYRMAHRLNPDYPLCSTRARIPAHKALNITFRKKLSPRKVRPQGGLLDCLAPAADADTNSGSLGREGPFLPHLPRPNRPARQSPNEFELHSIVEILNLKKKELHSLPEQPVPDMVMTRDLNPKPLDPKPTEILNLKKKELHSLPEQQPVPDMVMTRRHRSPPGKNMRIPKDLPMTIKSYRDGEGDGGTVLRPPRQIVVVVPSVALESPRKAVKQQQLVMVDGKSNDTPQAPPPQNESFGRLTGKYLTRRPSQEHRAGHFNNFRQYLKRTKSRKVAHLTAPAPTASVQDKKILNVSGRNNIPTLPVIPSIRSEDEIKTVMSENGVVLNGDFPANLSGVSSEDTSSSIRSELGKVFSNSSSSKSSSDNNNNSNSNAIRVKRLANPQQKMRRARDRHGRDSGNESSDSLDGLKDASLPEEGSRSRWSPGQKRYVVDKSHIHQQMATKNGYSVAKRYFDKQDREKYRSSLPSVLQSDQDYLTRTINGNPNKGKSGNHIVYVERSHGMRRRRGSEEGATEAHLRYRDPQRLLGQVPGHRNPPPSPASAEYKANIKRQAGDYNRPDSGIATRNSDSTGHSRNTDTSGVHHHTEITRKQQVMMKTPAIWDETFTMRVTEDETPSSDSDAESMPKPITMISINQSEIVQPPPNLHTTTTNSETTELYRGGYGRVAQDIDNRSLLSVPDSESLRANTPMPKALNDADDAESTSTISVPKITMTSLQSNIMSSSTGRQQQAQTGTTGGATPTQSQQTDWRSLADAAANTPNPLYVSRA
ncbi:hypothetical protein Bbelb_107250, partial [Branchiostoma belcheri]